MPDRGRDSDWLTVGEGCVRLSLQLDRTANDGWSSLLRIETMLVLLRDMSSAPRAVTEAAKLY